MKKDKNTKRRIVSGIVAGVYMVVLSAVFVLVPSIRKTAIGSWTGLFQVDLLLIASSIVPACCLYVGRSNDKYSDNLLTYLFMIWYFVLYVIKFRWLMDYDLHSLIGIFSFIVEVIILILPVGIICAILNAGGSAHALRPACWNCAYCDINEKVRSKNNNGDYWCKIYRKYVDESVCDDYSRRTDWES